MDKNVWLSRRALRLHAVILILVPGFMALCVWQITRALGGNSLSWAYVFEWPLFAAYAVYMWWRLVHEGALAAPEGSTGEASGGSAPGPVVGEDEDAELAEYNAYLAQLAERDRAGR
jgi:hypothetical protein